MKVKKAMTKNRKLLEDKIWNLTRFSPVLKKEDWTEDVMAEMKKFEKEIVHAMKVEIITCKEINTNLICR